MTHIQIQDLHYNIEKKNMNILLKWQFNVSGKFMLVTQKYRNHEKPLYDYAIYMEV